MARTAEHIKLDENKKEFIDKLKFTKKESTYKVYSRCIINIQKYEKELGKSFVNFSLDDHRLFLMTLSNQPSTIRTYLSVLSYYYAFLQEKGIANVGINPLDNLKFQEEIMTLCDNKFTYKYVTYRELRIITGMLYNARDKAILLLSWLKLNNEELLNLKTKDINFEERYLIVNDRKIEFDEYISDILEFTMIQEDYYDKNGKYTNNSSSDLTNGNYAPKKLAMSEYLIRGRKNIKCTHNIIHNTLGILRDFKPNDFNKKEELNWILFTKCKYITPMSIYKSRVFTDAYELEKQFRKEHEEEFKIQSKKTEKALNRFLQSEFKKENMSVTSALRDYKVFRDRDLKGE